MSIVNLFTASVATLYIIEVAILAFATAGAFNIIDIRKLKGQYVALAEVLLTSTVTELSLHFIIFKIFLIQVVKFCGGFAYLLSWVMYFVDIATIIGMGKLFYEMLEEKEIAETAIRVIDRKGHKGLQSFMSLELFKSLMNPFWRPPNLVIHPNITYATSEELRDALDNSNQDFDQPRKLMLDVITSNKKSTKPRPVLLHVHGGAWRGGRKDIFYPYEKLLVSEDDWIIVNIGYRLAPKSAYPNHLIDVKRAIRWTRQNIASFGGDPNFIVFSGDSAGAHLAAMASLTANDPQYQPGFEQVDTSCRGVVSVNGVLDLTYSNMINYFSKQVAMLSDVNMDFLNKHSPTTVIQQTKDCVPYLVLAGQRDTLVNSDVSVKFKKQFDEARHKNPCTLVLFPGGRHISYIAWSPRSLYAARIIQTWCRQLHNDELR
ncbi:hypothetical protein RMCBS344292_17360 [Rhizopus microsporus]|nr:hypothetical protein RMCBS344292_17360 [Rhizopus microsporus]